MDLVESQTLEFKRLWKDAQNSLIISCFQQQGSKNVVVNVVESTIDVVINVVVKSRSLIFMSLLNNHLSLGVVSPKKGEWIVNPWGESK